MIPANELLKALDAFSKPVVDFEKDFVFLAQTDIPERRVHLTRERVCMLAAERLRALQVLLGAAHTEKEKV